jgi:ORMDL family
MTCESYISPNVEWSQEPSTWFGQTLLVLTGLFIFSQIFSPQLSWTLTIVTYNLVTFVFFHAIIGDPFNQEYAHFTFWEQLVDQMEDSNAKSFFLAFPIVLFILGTRFGGFSNLFFMVNLSSLLLVVVPKLPFFIRKYKRHSAEATDKK